MEVYKHFILTLAAAPVILLLLGYSNSFTILLLLGYAILIGVFIDLDHFVLARGGAGDWLELKKAVSSPFSAFTDAEQIFERNVFPSEARFLSHIALLYLLTGLSFIVSGKLAFFTASIISLHITTDVYADIRNHEGVPTAPLFPLSPEKPPPAQHQD